MREPGFGSAVRGGARRHVSGDIEYRERFQLGGDITGYQHPFLQQVLDLLALRFRQRRPFSGDHQCLPDVGSCHSPKPALAAIFYA